MKEFRACNTCDRFLPLTELNYAKVRHWFVRKCRKCTNKYEAEQREKGRTEINRHVKYFDIIPMYSNIDRKYYENEDEMIYTAPNKEDLKNEELEIWHKIE